MGIFNLDGGIMKGLGKVTDIICLSVLFVICSIPVFTMGTAATALYYTVNKVVKNDRGYIFREYIAAFKNNFKHATPVWLLVLLLSAILGADLYIMQVWAENGSWLGSFSIVFLVLGAFFVAWILYLFAYMARFENTRKESMKNAALLMILHLPWTLILIGMAVGMSLLLYLIPVSVLFLPGVFTLVENLMLEKIFWKYMSEEDKAAEQERNQEFKN